MKSKYSAVAVLLVAVLACGYWPARADGPIGGDSNSTRLDRNHVPIGVVSVNSISNDNMIIDGRRIRGDHLIWGGELIEAPQGAGGRVTIDSLGEVSLGASSAMRLAKIGSGAEEPSLAVSLLTGQVTLRLTPFATAQVFAVTTKFISTAGANFKIAMSEGKPMLTSFSGEVRVEQQTPPADVNIRIIDDLGRPVASGSQFSIRARSTRQIQVQVTDKNDKPLPDLPVLFSLGDPCIGSLGAAGLAGGAVLQKKTDQRGIAAVVLTAGAARCAASITARVEGTNASVELKANVEEKHGFWNARNTLLVSAGVAAAGIGIGFAVANRGDNTPIRPIPPPNVKP